MTTSSLTLGSVFQGSHKGASSARTVSQLRRSDEQAAVARAEADIANPFARRPRGAMLSWRECAGVLVIFASLAALLVVALVRADGTWNTGASSVFGTAAKVSRRGR